MDLGRTFARSFVIAGAILASSAGPAVASSFGVNAHVPMDPVADEIAEASIGWVRVDFEWRLIEPERDRYEWQLFDELVERLQARGLRIFAGLGSTPAWATNGSEFNGVPTDSAQWQEFCYLVASRYRGRVDAWGIWNEPNSKRFWEGTRQEYIDILLLPGAAAIHGADPGALVCGPDLAHLSSLHWDDWLADVIRRAGGVLDVVTHHIYPSYGKAFEVTYDLDQKLDLPFSSPSVRRVLRDTGWWGRPFWLTETGVESDRYGERGQAEYYEDLLGDWFGRNPEARWIDRIFFYHMYDGPQPAPRSFGIIEIRSELERKEAFFAYRDFIADAVVDDAEIIGHRFPAFVDSTTVANIPVTVRNTGTTTWSSTTGHHLVVEIDVGGWSYTVTPLPQATQVAPGETVDFWIGLETAPDVTGQSRSLVTATARMADPGGRRFGDALTTTMVHTDLAPPVVHEHPLSVAASAGERASFKVAVASETPLSFRWRRNSVELVDGNGVSGSDTAWLQIEEVDGGSEGSYDCVVTNEAGSIVTWAARLAVDKGLSRRSTRRSAPLATGATLIVR
jgi:hypothetical protein